MLETMCEYALERLCVSGDGTRVRQRHSKYYRALAEGDRNPVLRLALDVTRTPSERLQGGSPLASCDLAGSIGIRCATIGWIRENVADAGCRPALLASSGRDARSAHAQRNLGEGEGHFE